MPRGLAVTTTGLGAVRGDLKRIDAGMAKALTAGLRKLGNESRDRIRSSTAPPHRTGRTRRSVKTSVTNKGVAMVSNEPQAPVWEYGGTIEPRGAPITFPRTGFVTKEVEGLGAGVEDELAALFDAISAF